ncbi:hypothetical protein RUM43_009898 [Polyplax serrata]|uniref:Uncharacterized protein n=1 Tax=Polyplax serrata TaxID=468196 RepID=A0AAN8PKM1_POLSC
MNLSSNNGGEVHQNGIEPVQNGEAATVAIEKVMTKESDDSAAEPTPNGQVEANGELNGEPEKTEEEGKKGEDKKDKKDKKEKKEKVVKKRFSFRNFRFSNKDKSKGSKDETSPEQVNEAPVEVSFACFNSFCDG